MLECSLGSSPLLFSCSYGEYSHATLPLQHPLAAEVGIELDMITNSSGAGSGTFCLNGRPITVGNGIVGHERDNLSRSYTPTPGTCGFMPADLYAPGTRPAIRADWVTGGACYELTMVGSPPLEHSWSATA
jgi:hypothetical protein